jgi:hypothetical protein
MAALIDRPELIVAAAFVLLVALLVGLRDWRWSVYGLLCYLPLSGIAILAAYGTSRGERAVAILVKDFVFIIPAYIGFLWYFVKRRRKFWFPGAPLVLFGLLALIVVIQGFNPDLPNHLVGLIGIKIWLFYVPLFFLGYYFVQSRRQLFSLLGLMAALAIIPAVIGIVEAIMYWAGDASTVYNVYGGAAAAATQNFTVFTVPGGCTIRRVPSTFSFFYQYYVFLASMLAVTYAWWRGGRPAGRQLKIGGALFVLLLVAVFVSGLRGAFVFIPFLLVVMFALSWHSPNRIPVLAVGGGLCAFGATALLMGTAVCGVTSHLGETFSGEIRPVVTTSISQAVHRTWLGLGAGSDSTGARYAFPDLQLHTQVGPVQEAWYVKTYLELGVFGLVIVLALLLMILVRGVQVHRRLRDPRLKMVSAAFIALIVWVLLYNGKAQYMDFDPINVYFWLFAGILMKLPLLQEEAPQPVPEPAAAPAPVEV